MSSSYARNKNNFLNRNFKTGFLMTPRMRRKNPLIMEYAEAK